MIISIISCTGAGVVNTFAAIIFNGMGFSTFVSLLLNLPIGALAFITILGSGYIGRTVRNSRLNIITVANLPVIVGCALLWRLSDSMRAGRIIGFYLVVFFSSVWTQCIGLGTSNVAGHTKKVTYASGTIIGYSIGIIIEPLLFDAKYAPTYDRSFVGILICFAVCVVVAQVLRFLLSHENQKRDREHGIPTLTHATEDLRDGENKSFRYNL